MKILVIGGMHGNEPLGLEVVEMLRRRPIEGVDTLLANKRAITRNARFVDSDLNRSFPGDARGAGYETKRAAEILDLIKRYDIALDFHNTHCPGNDCGFVGDTAPQQLYDLSAWLGLHKVIVADYDCLNKYAANCLSAEISLDSRKMNAKWWYKRISGLASLQTVKSAPSVEKYRFVYRISLDDRDRLQLQTKHLKAFEQIDPSLARQLGVKSPAYPIFIGDGYTPYNYGGLLNKLN